MFFYTRLKAIGVNGVDLEHASIPHLTAYLTTFKPEDDTLQAIKDKIKELSSKFCPLPSLHITGVSIKGKYCFVNIEMSIELMTCCENIWNNLLTYLSKDKNDMKIPPWVEALNDINIIKKKKELCLQYGSPNIFDQFTDPHFTVGVIAPENESMVDIKQVQETLDLWWQEMSCATNSSSGNELSCVLEKLSVGAVGDYGSVVVKDVNMTAEALSSRTRRS